MRKIHFSLILVCLGFLSGKVLAQTTTFNYTGSVQTYTVPAGVTSVIADVVGAQGGNFASPFAAGGKGGRAQGTIAVTPGQVLQIYVGQQGTTGTCGTGGIGGSNSGGGAQAGNGSAGGCGGSGGGGASDIRTTAGSTTASLATRLLVGGGGGGGCYAYCSGGEYGGAAGGTTGSIGYNCYYGSSTFYCGAGGSQTAGGSAGSGAATGSYGAGGTGTSGWYGGGGGGGYYGGGGGYMGGGGGGSSFVGGTGVTVTTNTANFQTGNGYVAITPIVPPLSLTGTPSSLTFGGVTSGTSSITPLSFVLTGTGLTGAPGNVTVTAPANYELSIEGTLWFSSLSIPYTGPTLAPWTIYVRFNAPTTPGSYCGNITLAGGGAPTANVNVCGTSSNLCTGTPTAGVAAITPGSGTSATTFSLSLTGTTVAGGITYQWRSSPTGVAGTFTDIPGAVGPSYTASGLASTTYFHCVVTCPSFAVATSNNVSATINLAAPACTGAPGDPFGSCSSYGMYHYAFNMTGASGSISDASGCNNSGYLDRTSLSCIINSGTTYTANVTAGPSNNIYNQIWIDFNGDGTFSSTETVGGNSTAHTGAAAITLTIPGTVSPGTYRMRSVISWFGTGLNYPNLSPCQTGHQYGEARDYKVIVLPSCSTPAAITGTNYTCAPGGTTTLASTTSGGTWTSSNTAVATVSASGVVTGVSAGGAVITYSVAGGCRTTRPIGIYGKPTVASITPSATTVCATTNLGLTAGSTTGSVVSYTWSGPAGYSATSSVNTTTLIPASSASTGSYSVTVTSSAGCISNPAASSTVTVLTAPAPFTGTLNVCQAATSTLSNSVTGGTWLSGSGGVASINSTSGLLTGLSAGLSNITYTLPNTCIRVEAATVNPLPVVTIAPSSSATVCLGQTASFTASSPNPTFALLSQDFNAGLSGGWSVENLSATTPLSWWAATTPPGADGTPGDGSLMMQAASSLYTGIFTESRLISPSFSTVGYGSATLSFDQYLISTTPDEIAKIEYSINGGSTWVTLVDQLNMFVGGPSWSSLTGDDQTIALPAGAIGQPDVRLRWNYKASSFYWFVDNVTVIAAMPASTFAWTGAAGLSCSTCTNPDITPTATGANNYSVTVTSSAGCNTTNAITVSVNPLPTTITGNLTTCVGSTTALGSTPSGGTWISSNTTNATIDINTGLLSGAAVGTTDITYTLPTTCMRSTTATVIPAPPAITGPTNVCVNSTITLTQGTSGTVWSSSATGVATVNSFGVVTGISAGNAVITCLMPTGCITTHNIREPG